MSTTMAEVDSAKIVRPMQIWRHHGLSVVLLSTFLGIWMLQAAAGFLSHNHARQESGWARLSLTEYLTSGHFWSATGENWESEFLQMAAFVWLTTWLYQKGSPESNDPDQEEPEPPVTADSPWPARRGGWVRAIYEYSLTLAFLLLFAIAFVVHLIAGWRGHNIEQAMHGQPAESFIEFFLGSDFWFQSMQNWQSEFLAIAAMVILAIFLRQKHSPESKPTNAPTWRNE